MLNTTLYATRFRTIVTSGITFALCLVSSVSGTAQSYGSNADQKEFDMTQTTATQKTNGPGVDKASIRPFPKINIPQTAIDGLRRRIAETQWPESETVADTSQGVPLATIQKLARYWATDYDW